MKHKRGGRCNGQEWCIGDWIKKKGKLYTVSGVWVGYVCFLLFLNSMVQLLHDSQSIRILSHQCTYRLLWSTKQMFKQKGVLIRNTKIVKPVSLRSQSNRLQRSLHNFRNCSANWDLPINPPSLTASLMDGLFPFNYPLPLEASCNAI